VSYRVSFRINPCVERARACQARACTGAEGFIHSEESVVMSPESVPLYFADRPAQYRLRRATLGGLLAPTTTAQRTADQASRSFASDARIWILLQIYKLTLTSASAQKNSFTRSTGKRRASHSRWPCKLPGTSQVKRLHRLGGKKSCGCSTERQR
jgi:hypothetical protein